MGAGPDRCIATLKTNKDIGADGNNLPENEVENFLNARYFGASESVLKILKIPTLKTHRG